MCFLVVACNRLFIYMPLCRINDCHTKSVVQNEPFFKTFRHFDKQWTLFSARTANSVQCAGVKVEIMSTFGSPLRGCKVGQMARKLVFLIQWTIQACISLDLLSSICGVRMVQWLGCPPPPL